MAKQLGTNFVGALCAGGKTTRLHTDYIKLLWFRSTRGAAIHNDYVGKSSIDGDKKLSCVIVELTRSHAPIYSKELLK